MTCVLTSEEVRATFETPAKVEFPTVRGRPLPLRITCEDAEFRGTTIVQPGVTDLKISAPYVSGMSSAAMKAGVDHPGTLWVFTKAPVWVSVRPTGG
ncbi:MAG: hypothetical protein RID23_06440 [Roseovarius sp.]